MSDRIRRVPPATRQEIYDFADATKEKHGLHDLSLYPAHGYLRLANLIVPRERQGQGIGTNAMQDITGFADRYAMPMSLTTAVKDPNWGTTSAGRLKRFYRQFGFVENRGRWPEVSDNMIREVQQ